MVVVETKSKINPKKEDEFILSHQQMQQLDDGGTASDDEKENISPLSKEAINNDSEKKDANLFNWNKSEMMHNPGASRKENAQEQKITFSKHSWGTTPREKTFLKHERTQNALRTPSPSVPNVSYLKKKMKDSSLSTPFLLRGSPSGPTSTTSSTTTTTTNQQAKSKSGGGSMLSSWSDESPTTITNFPSDEKAGKNKNSQKTTVEGEGGLSPANLFSNRVYSAMIENRKRKHQLLRLLMTIIGVGG